LVVGAWNSLDTLSTPFCSRVAASLKSPPTTTSLRAGSALLVAAGDNPDRLRSEPSFAALCGVSPLDASSGRHRRHRLNRGGDREANCALFRIVLCRLIREERTRSYMARRLGEGKTKKEVIRCLKRHVAREVFTAIRQDLQGQEMKRSNSLSEAA
jgi:transposase